MFNLDASSDAIQEMERNLRLHEDVLRYITIRVEELRAEPSPMAQGKGDRDRADVAVGTGRKASRLKLSRRRAGRGSRPERSTRRRTTGSRCRRDGSRRRGEQGMSNGRSGGGGRRPFFRRRKSCPLRARTRRPSIIAIRSCCPDTFRNAARSYRAVLPQYRQKQRELARAIKGLLPWLASHVIH